MSVWTYLGIAVAVVVLVNVLLILFFVVLNQRSHDDD